MVNTVEEQKLPRDFDTRMLLIIVIMMATYFVLLLVGVFNKAWASANWPMTIPILFLSTIIAIMIWPMPAMAPSEGREAAPALVERRNYAWVWWLVGIVVVAAIIVAIILAT